MAEQILQRAEPQTMTPEAATNAKPIEFSPKTLNASAAMAKEVADRKHVPQIETDALLRDIASDFEKEGIPLSPEEKSKWNESFTRTLRLQEPPPTQGEGEAASEDRVNLREYTDTFNTIYHTYHLDEIGTRLGVLEGVMLSNKLVRMLSRIGYMYLPKHVQKNFGQAQEAGDILQKAFEDQKFSKDATGKLVRIGLKLGWPVLAPALATLSTSIADGIARKQFVKEQMVLRSSINKRIADSVFMRDFEFVHDKPPAEIMNIIDKGKEATMALMDATYTQVLPRIAAVGSSVAPQLFENPVLGIIGALRLPMSMKASEEHIAEMLTQRRKELNRKDAVDTRILTSLGSVEIVKTSDSIAEAVEDLRKSMHEKDALREKGEQKGVSRAKKQEYLDMFFDLGIPGLAAGWRFVSDMGWRDAWMAKMGMKGGTKTTVEQKSDDMAPMMDALASVFGATQEEVQEAKEQQKQMQNRMKTGMAAFSAYSAFSQVQASQEAVRENVQALTDLYANKIQPAIQDIKRMEELLGPYDQVDTPEGPKEKARMAVDGLNNFDISVKNLSFKDILHDVSLDIPQGSFVTIKGPSGIGKTTFFRHLMGLYGAPEGKVQYGGVDLQHIKKFGEQSVYSKIAYANQNPQFFENMTLRENLLLWTKKPTTDIEIRQTLHDLRLDGLIERLDSKVKHYSGGELRRIGIARALLKDPRVLFLDEPTANLDEESAKQVLEIIKGLRVKRPEMTVVAVTHDPNFEAIAEQIVDFREINRKPEVADG